MSNGRATATETRREEILAAAGSIFVHYGFAHASLDLIAREAGISRTGLYHHFGNKEEIFRAMAEQLHAASLSAAAECSRTEGPVGQRLLGVLRAELGRFCQHLAATRPGSEIIDESNRLCGDLIADGSRKFHRIVASLLRAADKAGEIDLARAAMSADAVATLIIQSAYGLQASSGGEPPSPAQYDKRLEQLVRLTLAGLDRDKHLF